MMNAVKVLVLGGSGFLSKEVAAESVRRGHDVTCANRGISGSIPDGARLVVWDRSQPVPPEIGDGYDAVVDVTLYPSRARSAVAAVPSAHWVFVSTLDVYADESTPGGRPSTLPLREPIFDDVDLDVDVEGYGPMKVACEQLVRDTAASATIIRPGLIVGPGDDSGRFGYWPVRLAEEGTVLAPGRPDDTVQVIDVRDLATWIVDAAEARLGGDYDGINRASTMEDFLLSVAAGCGAEVELVWVPQEFLSEQGIKPWVGPESLPLWLPRPQYDGMMSHDVEPSYDAGLVTRPIADTARETLSWLRDSPGVEITGITRECETAVLTAWRRRSAP